MKPLEKDIFDYSNNSRRQRTLKSWVFKHPIGRGRLNQSESRFKTIFSFKVYKALQELIYIYLSTMIFILRRYINIIKEKITKKTSLSNTTILIHSKLTTLHLSQVWFHSSAWMVGPYGPTIHFLLCMSIEGSLGFIIWCIQSFPKNAFRGHRTKSPGAVLGVRFPCKFALYFHPRKICNELNFIRTDYRVRYG